MCETKGKGFTVWGHKTTPSLVQKHVDALILHDFVENVAHELTKSLAKLPKGEKTMKCTWIGPKGGDWHDPKNWEGGRVPKGDDL
jgi:hypothetical protein